MSLSKKLRNLATTASLVGTLATTSVFGINHQNPQQTYNQQKPVIVAQASREEQEEKTNRVSKKYPKEFRFTINGKPSSVVYTYLDTISSQKYNELFGREK